jgi:hypothetical protein
MNKPSVVYNPSGTRLELDYVADTIFHSAPNSCSSFTFRIYGGGSSNIQTLQLVSAIRELNIDQTLYTIEILTCDDVNVNRYSIKDIVSWLLASSVHFITGHVHQGLQLQILDSSSNSIQSGHRRFTMNSILSELQRLKLHRGFPFKNYLQCPVFLQDKYVYLAILQNQGMCNPTFKVDRNSWFDGTEENSTILLSTIDDFLDNCNEEGCGWVVKLPFVTNQIVKGLKTKDEVIKKLRSIFSNDKQGIYPYAMIQPCMRNRKEYKVVYIPSKSIVYVSSSTTTAGHYKKAFPTGKDHCDLFDFVKRAVEAFQDACPHSICDGLFRVDVFMNQANKFIVNEFESLEAVYYGKSILENTVTNYLKDYWYGKLIDIDLIQQLISTNSCKTKDEVVEKEKCSSVKKRKIIQG